MKPQAKPVFLIAGSDRDLVEYKSFEVVDINRQKGIEPETYSILERGIDELLTMINQPTLLGGEEFIWIRDGERLRKNQLKKLKTLLEKGVSRQLLITAVEKGRKIGRWESLKKIENVRSKLYKYPKNSDYVRELKKFAGKRSKTLEPSAAETLIKKCRGNFGLSVRELDKLLWFYLDKPKITGKEVNNFVNTVPEARLFSFIDAYLSNDGREAGIHLEEILRSGEKPEAVFYILLSSFSSFVKAVTALKLKMGDSEVAEYADLKKWQVRNYKRFSKEWKWDQLVDIYWNALRYDMKVKRGDERNLKNVLNRMVIELPSMKKA